LKFEKTTLPPETNGKNKISNFENWIEIWKKNWFWNLNKIGHTKGNGKNWNTSRNFEIKFFINFHFWNLKWKFPLNLKKLATSAEGNEKNWNEEIIYFVYATDIKLLIIPLYHLCVPPYITGVSCGGIQLISAVKPFIPVLFQQWYRVVWSTVKEPLEMHFHMSRLIEAPFGIVSKFEYFSHKF
jgi:hypothetical protein